MIRPCTPQDFDQILAIINDGAQAYKDVIPADRFPDPYMSHDYLNHEIASGIIFYGYENPQDTQDPATLAGVMGIQHVHDVTLIRHAYVRTTHQKQGIGALLLTHLRELTDSRSSSAPGPTHHGPSASISATASAPSAPKKKPASSNATGPSPTVRSKPPSSSQTRSGSRNKAGGPHLNRGAPSSRQSHRR
jgi:GNAT superfamily N-acetyltransferase